MKKQSNFRRLLEYAGKYKFLTYASWILSAASAIIALIPFFYIWKIIKEIISVSPDFSKVENLIGYGTNAVVFAVISFLVYVCGLMCSHLSAFRVAANMRIKLCEHLAKLPTGFCESFGSGKLRKIINDSTAATENYLAHLLPDKWGAIATPIGLLVLLLVFDWRLGLLSLIPVVLAFLSMSTMVGKGMEEKMKQYNNALAAMSNEAVEYVRGIPVVKTFGQSVFSFKRFKSTIDEYEKWVIAYTKQMRVPMMFYTAAVNGVFAFLIAGAIIFTKNGVTNEFLLNLLFYIIITPVISLTLTKIMYMSENGMVINDAFDRIDSILETEPFEYGNKHIQNTDIELSNVSFSYDGKNDVLKNVSLNINKGETVAFVGPSGGGKSTLASLISRFFDVTDGSIKIGGTDVRDISQKELCDMVSFVFQNSKLIKGTVFENVKMGKPNATKQEIENALYAAQCGDIIEKLPQGVNTVIGTEGTYLSGGEMQRIAIARAILKNSPIIILDEATAFADPDNEVKVQRAMSELAKGKTVIMIAHRLSTVSDADCIYVVENGKIAENGNFDELMRKKGLFFKMQNDYQKSVTWKVAKEGESL